MFALCLPVILSGTTRGRPSYDSLNYHEKTIRQFAQELPNPNLKDYLSATTPGYHLVLAAVGRGVAGIGADGRSAYETNLTPNPPDPRIFRQRQFLQFVGLTFSLVMLYAIGHWTERRIARNQFEPGPVLVSITLALPFIGSPYVYQSAAWLLPDNAAWLGVLAILLLALRPRVSVAALAVMGLFLIWLVLARQIHAWAAGLVWAAGWLSASLANRRDERTGALLQLTDVLYLRESKGIIHKVGVALLCTMPAAIVCGLLWSLWGRQFTPPTFISWHHAGVQGATPAFILALLAILSPFYAGWLRPGAAAAWRDHRASLFVAVVAGLLLAVIPPSTWDMEAGRFGGVWSVYKRAGEFGGRSIALVFLAPLGAIVVVAALAGIGLRQRWVMLAALAGFAVANAANPQLWQRYHEPFVLIWITIASALAASRQTASDTPGLPRVWKLAGPAVLALFLGAINAATILRAAVESDEGFRLGHIDSPPTNKPSGERPS